MCLSQGVMRRSDRQAWRPSPPPEDALPNVTRWPHLGGGAQFFAFSRKRIWTLRGNGVKARRLVGLHVFGGVVRTVAQQT
jgi:hypothetical protein